MSQLLACLVASRPCLYLALGLATMGIAPVASANPAESAGVRLSMSMRQAKTDPVTPKSAAEARAPLQKQANAMHQGGDDVGAANMLMAQAERLKDPVLYLDAADSFLMVAEADNNLQWLDGAQQMADIATDMILYLQDNGGSANWAPLANEHVAMVLERARGFEQRSAAARTRIEDALSSEPAVEQSEQDKGPAKPGKGMFIAGAALTGVGVLGLGLGATGLALGASAQRKVGDPLVYENEHRQAERSGRAGNAMAYIGGGLGLVGLGVGIGLMVVGKKRQRAAGNSLEDGDTDAKGESESGDDPTLAIIPGFRGLTLRGSF